MVVAHVAPSQCPPSVGAHAGGESIRQSSISQSSPQRQAATRCRNYCSLSFCLSVSLARPLAENKKNTRKKTCSPRVPRLLRLPLLVKIAGWFIAKRKWVFFLSALPTYLPFLYLDYVHSSQNVSADLFFWCIVFRSPPCQLCIFNGCVGSAGNI